jgi:hypothetical protein
MELNAQNNFLMAGSNKQPRLLAIVATIVMTVLGGVVVGILVGKTYISFKRYQTRPEVHLTVGSSLSLPSITWASSDRTLVLILQKGCHFCSESAPFYRRIVHETSGRTDLRLLAVLPQDVNEAKEYLNDLDVRIEEVKQAYLGGIGVSGTPTLVLVDNTGTVTNLWEGKLAAPVESAVLNSLRSGRHTSAVNSEALNGQTLVFR